MATMNRTVARLANITAALIATVSAAVVLSAMSGVTDVRPTGATGAIPTLPASQLVTGRYDVPCGVLKVYADTTARFDPSGTCE